MVYIIEGGTQLSGSVAVQGSKNSVLPILAASILHNGTTLLRNVPNLADVATSLEILVHLGAAVKYDGFTVEIETRNIQKFDIPAALMLRMRSSVIFLGAMLVRTGHASMGTPGGCELGPRPIDMHLAALSKMGVKIENGYDPDGKGVSLECSCEEIIARDIVLPFPSVGATENVMIAACGAHGITRIKNPAREPEIMDLANYINALGGEVSGAGSRVIFVKGQRPLHDCEFDIPGDRIAAGTLLCAAAACGGCVRLSGIQPSRLILPLETLEIMGCTLEKGDNHINLERRRRLRSGGFIHTEPYPGFPTDLQPTFMAAATLTRGATRFEENIFACRYAHTEGLCDMGARIDVSKKTALVRGVKELHGVEAEAADLRGGAALIIGALAAQGRSKIGGVCHVERGYEKIEETLTSLGGSIRLG